MCYAGVASARNRVQTGKAAAWLTLVQSYVRAVSAGDYVTCWLANAGHVS